MFPPWRHQHEIHASKFLTTHNQKQIYPPKNDGLSPVFKLFTRILLNVKKEIQFEGHLHPRNDRKKFILIAPQK